MNFKKLLAMMLFIGSGASWTQETNRLYIPEEIRLDYTILMREGKRNEVLNCMQFGKDAFYLKQWDLAAYCFENALLGIETVFAHSEQAKTARSLWGWEKDKYFKGEPYERVMAYFYRGLTFYQSGDYQNARACFRAAILEDSYAAEFKYNCDFCSVLFLLGWTCRVIDDERGARDAFQELAELNPTIKTPPPHHNVLVLIETGTAPRKVVDGIGHNILRYKRGKFIREIAPRLIVDGIEQTAFELDDLYWQATTRGGRQFDAILADQVQWKKGLAITSEIIGSGSVIANPTESDRTSQTLTASSAALALISNAVKAEADFRFWFNLSDRLHAVTLNLPPGPHHYEITYIDRQGNTVPWLGENGEWEVIGHQQPIFFLYSQKQLYADFPRPNDDPYLQIIP